MSDDDSISPPSGFTLVPSAPPPDDPASHEEAGQPTPPPGFSLVAPPQQMSRTERFGTGMLDPLYGTGQLVAHTMPDANAALMRALPPRLRDQMGGQQPAAADVADQTVSAREAQIKSESPEGTDWYRVAGQIASPVNYLPTASAGPVARAIEMGARSGAMQPETGTDYQRAKSTDIAGGAAAGLVTGAAGKLLSGTVAPSVRAPAQQLLDQGVDLTPGQIAGGVTRRAEEAAKSAPILGTSIRKAEGRAIDTFNRATANQALEPIGVTIPETLAGRDIIDHGQQALSQAYNDLLPQMSFRMDQPFVEDMTKLRSMVNELPAAQRDQFLSVIRNRLTGRLEPTGGMNGDTLKQVQSELTNFATAYKGAPDPAQRQLGHAIDAVKDAVEDTLMRQNPDQADQLKAINSAYAMFTRVEGAAARRATSNGQFTPGDLLGAIKSADKTVRRRAFSRGDALLQDWAETANKVISNKLPDSGSPERLLWDVGGGGGAFLMNPWIPAGLVAGSAPYTRIGGNIVRGVATPGPTREAAGAAIQGIVPYAAPATEDIRTGIMGRPGRRGIVQ